MAMENSAQELERILNGDYKDAFNAQDYFSVDNQSTCHVFDVTNDEGIMKSNVDGDGLVKMIRVLLPHPSLPFPSPPKFEFF